MFEISRSLRLKDKQGAATIQNESIYSGVKWRFVICDFPRFVRKK